MTHLEYFEQRSQEFATSMKSAMERNDTESEYVYLGASTAMDVAKGWAQEGMTERELTEKFQELEEKANDQAEHYEETKFSDKAHFYAGGALGYRMARLRLM